MQHLSFAEAEESPCLTLLLPPIFAATYDLTYPDHHNNVLVKIPQALNCEYPPCRGKQKEWGWGSLWYFLFGKQHGSLYGQFGFDFLLPRNRFFMNLETVWCYWYFAAKNQFEANFHISFLSKSGFRQFLEI